MRAPATMFVGVRKLPVGAQHAVPHFSKVINPFRNPARFIVILSKAKDLNRSTTSTRHSPRFSATRTRT